MWGRYGRFDQTGFRRRSQRRYSSVGWRVSLVGCCRRSLLSHRQTDEPLLCPGGTVTIESDADRASMRIVRFVADRRDVDPTELPPLGRRIDPDALDTVVDSLADDEYVRFEYDGVLLYVWGDGEITTNDD